MDSAVNVSFLVSTAYTITLLVTFVFKKDCIIPLTYRTSFNDWSAVERVFRDHPNATDQAGWNVANGNLSQAMWCDTHPNLPPVDQLRSQAKTSRMCTCAFNFMMDNYENNSRKALTDHTLLPADVADMQYKDLLDSCLRERPTWRKDVCDICKVHLGIPVLIACLCLSVLSSRASRFSQENMQNTAYYLPLALALAVAGCSLGLDVFAGIPVTLSVISLLLEASYIYPCASGIDIYWNYQRFFIGAVAIWAAVTHQARDIYLSTSYGVLGFFVGLLAYTICLTRFSITSPYVRGACLYAWMGICCSTASFALLIQQHWYSRSPFYSSSVSVVCLILGCLQCVSLAPGVWYSEVVQMYGGLVLLTACFIAVMVDLVNF